MDNETPNSREIQAAFAEYDRQETINNFKVACAIGMALMPAGFVLDSFVYPVQVGYFLKLRLLVSGTHVKINPVLPELIAWMKSRSLTMRNVIKTILAKLPLPVQATAMLWLYIYLNRAVEPSYHNVNNYKPFFVICGKLQ